MKAAFGLVLALAAAPALAIDVSASVSNVRIELIDLAPDDGIEPDFSFRAGYSSWAIDNYRGGRDSGVTDFAWEPTGGAVRSIRAELTEDSISLHGSTSNGGFTGRATATSEPWNFAFGLDVTQNTQIRITGLLSASVVGRGQGIAGATIGLSRPTGVWPDGSEAIADAVASSRGGTDSKSFSFEYSTGAAKESLGLHADAEVWGFAQPVPEPETYALMGAGLLALVLRRRVPTR
ncbi:PEP-CTERM sorting domain-containing protein [Caldimonas brevitalea]|uniref:Ice-binding protein C-terminal domain-containing protein n=1 Tax=Caldimonas brevitalea TaxID=413882 RepID=A0A0G3BQP8_9BURK|nr:PEP-CTERM sorting domain-containing protein [Caldimonas brevitalea]AKJ28855.1 hypothetical protein AAW51_2164 [Caldimonas brevitalea]